MAYNIFFIQEKFKKNDNRFDSILTATRNSILHVIEAHIVKELKRSIYALIYSSLSQIVRFHAKVFTTLMI